MWPFNWKLSVCTFTRCYLFLKILENEIRKFGRNLPLATFGSERVKWKCASWMFSSCKDQICKYLRCQFKIHYNGWCSLKIYISGVNTTCVNCVKASVNLTEFVHSFTLALFSNEVVVRQFCSHHDCTDYTEYYTLYYILMKRCNNV